MDVKRVKVDKGSLFGHLDIYPPDPIFHVKDAYLADKSPNKVNLGIGGEITNLEWWGRGGVTVQCLNRWDPLHDFFQDEMRVTNHWGWGWGGSEPSFHVAECCKQADARACW